MDKSRIEAAERDIIAELATSVEGYKNLTVLCDEFGSRFGGTDEDRRAVDYMLQRFQEYGLENVHKEEFMHNAWTRGPATLHTIAPLSQEFKCISLPYNVASDVEGELFYVGHGTPDDFEAAGDAIRGKIVMANAKSPSFFHRGVHRCEKIGRAIAGGAIGFIWMRWDPGLLEETGAARWGKPVEVPCIGVSREAGEALVRMQEKGPVRVRIHTTDTVKPAPVWNVVAEIKGRTEPDKVILIGAHYDGHDIAPGAMDDGAGAMVVMETARALARHKDVIGKTLRFVLFPIEEIGLGGSYNYVNMHRDELDNIEMMFNLDGAGRSFAQPGVQLYGKWASLFNFFRSIGKEMKQPIQVANGISLYSDHLPFQLMGIPAGGIREFSDTNTGTRGWGHSAADTLDKVSPRALEGTAAFMARLALRMSNRTDWPGRRISEQAAQEALGPEYMEVLKLEKRWPFYEWIPELVTKP
ncbi:MAG TPA: M28 family peptidase [Firmicutes bacterium]|nr:M28 family peptidase [Candidatus Fermentithermobacillaceae bacterium]